MYDLARTEGSSDSDIRMVIDLIKLANDYLCDTTGGQKTSLSKSEISILRNEINSIEELELIETTNEFGYTLLHLAVIAGKYDLAVNMMENGFSIYDRNNSGTTVLQLANISILNVARNSNMDYELSLKDLALFKGAILDTVDNIDIQISDSGESLIDGFMKDHELFEKMLEKTNDPLFYFFKEGITSNLDNSSTKIAISHGDRFWSTGFWSLSRLYRKSNPNVKFFLITEEMVEDGGDEFLKQFDAFINPGAADSFTANANFSKGSSFSKKDCVFALDIERFYQLILEKSDELNIPYFGVCAGAQHLALYEGAKLKYLEGYNGGKHDVTFLKYTLPYFLALSEGERKDLIEDKDGGHLWEREVKVTNARTAHHYAAVPESLNANDLSLGACSEEGVPMSFESRGIRLATQFHPEDYYNREGRERETYFLNGFFAIAGLYHRYRSGEISINPVDYFADFSKILDFLAHREDYISSAKEELMESLVGDYLESLDQLL